MNKRVLISIMGGILVVAFFGLWLWLGYLSGVRHVEKQRAEEAEVEVVEPVVEEIEVEEAPRYFDVPLDRDLQDHIFAESEKYNVDPALIVAMIQKESTFNAGAIGDSGNSLGLMQIQPRWHRERMDILGCHDLLDPYQNVTVGITIISELIEKDRGLEWALMCYNGGSPYANEKVAAGIVTDYVKLVYQYRDALTMVC